MVWFRKTTEKGDMSPELYIREKAIYSYKGSRSAWLSQLGSKRCLVNTPRLAIENVWTGTHSLYLGGHLEIECWVAFSLPLTGRLSLFLSLDFSPLRPWLRNSIKSDWCWWRHTERWLWIIAEYWGRTETDRRKARKRGTIAGSEWLMTESNPSVFL